MTEFFSFFGRVEATCPSANKVVAPLEENQNFTPTVLKSCGPLPRNMQLVGKFCALAGVGGGYLTKTLAK